MSRPAVARIHLKHIVHNYLLARSLSGDNSQTIAVVKADAYGHGAVQVAKALSPFTKVFAVACIEEALELRAAGITHPILLLEGFFTEDELPVIAEQGFWTAIHRMEQVEQIHRATLTAKIPVWVKVDSGMHRLGFEPYEVANVVKRVRSTEKVSDVIVMTHFANADLDKPAGIDAIAQMERVLTATTGLDLGYSMANSAALLTQPSTRKQWQRPGIILYGSSPLETETDISKKLKPAMTLESEIIASRWVPAGESVGYGSRFVADKPTLVGTVAMGYADGYPRQAIEGTPVIVNGQKTRLIGRVSMDMMTLDLTPVQTAHIGSKVELWGEQLPASEVARNSGTISYHLFTGITKRVPRSFT